MNWSYKYSQEIIDMLKGQGIDVTDVKVVNTISLIIGNAMEEAKKVGIQEGIQTGIKRACRKITETINNIVE